MSLLDKEHAKSHKKMKAVVKKKSSAVEKLSKKAKKKAGDAELAEEHELKVNTWRRDSSLYHIFCEGSGSNNNRGCLGGQREGRGEGHPGK